MLEQNCGRYEGLCSTESEINKSTPVGFEQHKLRIFSFKVRFRFIHNSVFNTISYDGLDSFRKRQTNAVMHMVPAEN